jgi:hypothetical protein
LKVGAEILQSRATPLTRAIGRVNPRDADPVAFVEVADAVA